MQLLINIPDEQIEKSLAESKFIHEDEGEMGHVNIMMLYTNGKLEFVEVVRKENFYSCEYKVLPKGHGDLVDRDIINERYGDIYDSAINCANQPTYKYLLDKFSMCLDSAPAIIEADKE